MTREEMYARNIMARRALIPSGNSRTVRRTQQIFSQTTTAYVAGQGFTFNVIPAAAGIITRFVVEVEGIIANSGGADVQTRRQNGPYAIFSNVQYIDTSNMTRINCPSWYLHHVATYRRRGAFNAALTSDSNIFANNFNVSLSPSSVNSVPGSTNFRVFFEVPLAYASDDLRGAVLANLINATQQLTLTLNPNFFVTSTDVVNLAEAGYQSDGATLGDLASVTVKVYQEYIDQFAGMEMPTIDFSTQYQLQTTGGYNLVANTDLIQPYANFRSYLTTLIRYNNAGTFNAGSDINYLAIRAANSTDLLRYDPYMSAHLTRTKIYDDELPGYYMIDHRDKPIFTDQYGNVSAVVNASSVTSINSTVTFGYEQLALMTQVNGATQNLSGT